MARETRLGEMLQQTVEQAATTAEAIQKAVADLPLRILETNGLLKGPVHDLRRVQERAIGGIYDLVRQINRDVARFVAGLVERAAPGSKTDTSSVA